MSRSHCSDFVQQEDLNLRFFDTVLTTQHKNAQKWRFTKTPFKVDIIKDRLFSNTVNQCDRTKTDICLDHNIVKRLKPQKRILSSFGVSNVNPHKQIFYPDFCTETEKCERLVDIYKSDKFVSGAV